MKTQGSKETTFGVRYTLDIDINHGIILESKDYPNHLILTEAYICLRRGSSDGRIEFKGPTSTDPGLRIDEKVMTAIQRRLSEKKTHWSNGYEFKNVNLVPGDKAEQVCSVLAKGVKSISISLRGPQDYFRGVKVIVCGPQPIFLVRKDFINEESSSRNFVVRKRKPQQAGFYAGMTDYNYWFMVEGEYIKK